MPTPMAAIWGFNDTLISIWEGRGQRRLGSVIRPGGAGKMVIFFCQWRQQGEMATLAPPMNGDYEWNAMAAAGYFVIHGLPLQRL
jgi:hypothetical protein